MESSYYLVELKEFAAAAEHHTNKPIFSQTAALISSPCTELWLWLKYKWKFSETNPAANDAMPAAVDRAAEKNSCWT